MTPVLCVLFVIFSKGWSLAIETKLDLPTPVVFTGSDGQPVTIDSSLSPKIIKAFYEINFVQVAKPDPNKSHITITDSKGCPYSKDLCKFYFAPTKVSIVQKVDDLIAESKKETEVPVIQGVAVADEEKLLKELNPKIMTHLRQNKAVQRTNTQDRDVPVYRGTVNVEGVLNRPEVATLPDYRPRYPEIKKQCFQGACWSYHS